MKKIINNKEIIAGGSKFLGLGNIGFFTITTIGSMLGSFINNVSNLAVNDILKSKGIDVNLSSYNWDNGFIRMSADAYKSSIVF